VLGNQHAANQIEDGFVYRMGTFRLGTFTFIRSGRDSGIRKFSNYVEMSIRSSCNGALAPQASFMIEPPFANHP